MKKETIQKELIKAEIDLASLKKDISKDIKDIGFISHSLRRHKKLLESKILNLTERLNKPEPKKVVKKSKKTE